jgi:hypothetical protein
MVGEIIRDLPIGDVKPNPKNPRRRTNTESIKRSIIVNGFRTPVIIDENNMLLAGHGRVVALQELEYQTIPLVVKYSDLTEQQKMDFMVRDNKTTELAEWDMSKLTVEFSGLELKDLGFDILRGNNIEQTTAELPLEFDVNREMDYIVVFSDNDEDFMFLHSKLGLGEVMHPKSHRVGRARAVNAKKLIELLERQI